MTDKNYSVVVPVYNSENTLKELFTRIKAEFEKINETFEVIFIEDCGRDKSWGRLVELKKENPDEITIIKLAKNFGQHNAILCGFNHVKGRQVITIDDDLQIPPEEISKLIKAQSEKPADVTYGIYTEKKHNFFRNLGSYLVQKIFKKIFNAQNNITSFRLLSSQMVERLKKHKENFVFIDGLLHWYTNDFAFININHEPRKSGKSGYGPLKLVSLANNLLFNFTTLPLRWMIQLGFAFSIISFLSAVIFIFRKFAYDVPIGYTSIIVILFFIFSILLLVIGVVGEYISRLYSVQNEKPQYSIKEIK
jgi:polyisoprenyl-phosphate glycosyltransferase